MQRTNSTTCYFDYSLNQLVQADNNGAVHPGFTLPETQQEQRHRQDLEARRRRRQEELVKLSKVQQETSRLREEARQLKDQRKELQERVKPEEVVLSGLTSEQLEELLEPWVPDPAEELTAEEIEVLLEPWEPEQTTQA